MLLFLGRIFRVDYPVPVQKLAGMNRPLPISVSCNGNGICVPPPPPPGGGGTARFLLVPVHSVDKMPDMIFHTGIMGVIVFGGCGAFPRCFSVSPPPPPPSRGGATWPQGLGGLGSSK
jgi:hypothetical protein